MRILMLNYEYPPLGGGASPTTKEIAEQTAARGHDVDVITSHFTGLPKTERHDSLRIFRVSAGRKKKETADFPEMFLYTLNGYRKAASLTKKHRYDLIHAHFIIPTGAVAYALHKRFDLPYMITSHGSDVPGYNPDRFRILHTFLRVPWKVIAKNATFITMPSGFFKGMLARHLPEEKLKVIPSGIYLEEGKKKKEPIILYTGRHLPRKGIEYLIQAADKLPKPWRVIITGDGPYRKELERLADTVDAPVNFTGWIEKSALIDLYERSSILVLASEEESFGLSIAEAMNYGNAIITTKGTACEEVAGEAGLLVPKRDADAIRRHLVDLIAHPKKLKDYQKKSLKRAEDFSWDKIIDSFLELYEKI